MTNKTTTPAANAPFVVRPNADSGEAMVIAPSGRIEFMSFWQFIRFTWSALRAGHKVEVRSD